MIETLVIGCFCFFLGVIVSNIMIVRAMRKIADDPTSDILERKILIEKYQDAYLAFNANENNQFVAQSENLEELVNNLVGDGVIIQTMSKEIYDELVIILAKTPTS